MMLAGRLMLRGTCVLPQLRLCRAALLRTVRRNAPRGRAPPLRGGAAAAAAAAAAILTLSKPCNTRPIAAVSRRRQPEVALVLVLLLTLTLV